MRIRMRVLSSWFRGDWEKSWMQMCACLWFVIKLNLCLVQTMSDRRQHLASVIKAEIPGRHQSQAGKCSFPTVAARLQSQLLGKLPHHQNCAGENLINSHFLAGRTRRGKFEAAGLEGHSARRWIDIPEIINGIIFWLLCVLGPFQGISLWWNSQKISNYIRDDRRMMRMPGHPVEWLSIRFPFSSLV